MGKPIRRRLVLAAEIAAAGHGDEPECAAQRDLSDAVTP
jgi:hypothetical protein